MGARAAGKVPDDDPESWFPAEMVTEWFRECGFASEEFKIRSAARALLNAYGQLLGQALFQWKLQDEALGDRSHTGPTTALRNRLTSIANTAQRLQADLKAIRGELFLHRAKGKDSELQELHQSLHQAFCDGQLSRQRAFRCSEPTDESGWNIDVGPHATTMPTFLEQGLESLSEAAKNMTVANRSAPMPLDRSMQTIRDQFIRDIVQIWVTTTSMRPTVGVWYNRSAQRRSSVFQTFHEIIGGHVAGLIVKCLRIDWDSAPKKVKNNVRARFHALGLLGVSPSTLARRIRSVQFDPEPPGSL